MAWGRLTDHEAGNLRMLRLLIFRVDAVVPDEGVRHDHVLPGVGRVGEDLLVAGHRGIENHLSEGRAPGSEAATVEATTVLEDQVGGVTLCVVDHAFSPPLSKMFRASRVVRVGARLPLRRGNLEARRVESSVAPCPVP